MAETPCLISGLMNILINQKWIKSYKLNSHFAVTSPAEAVSYSRVAYTGQKHPNQKLIIKNQKSKILN